MFYSIQYVLKKLDVHNASKRERHAAEQEAKLLSRLKHPNIVSYKDSFETDEGQLYIAMGYCEGGDLYTRLKEQKGTSLDERQIVEWFVQIAMALQVSNLFTVKRVMLLAITGIFGAFENITIWRRFNLAILLEESGWVQYLFIW